MAASPESAGEVPGDESVVLLRLDHGSLPSRDALADDQAAAASTSDPVGVWQLHSRVLHELAEARVLAARAVEQTALVGAREQHAADLRRLLASQDQVIGAFQMLLRQNEQAPRVGEQSAVATVMPAIATARVEPAPPAVQPTPTADPPAADSAAFSLADVWPPASDLAGLWPPSTELMLQAGGMLLVLMLLGWALVLRSRRTSARLDDEEGAWLAEQEPAEAASAEQEPGEDATLRERLRQRNRGSRVAPELVNADHEPLEMPGAAGPANPAGNAGAPVGPGPLGGVSARAGTEPRLLKEVDTLIAFEEYERAAAMLREQIEKHPKNPEYHLRLLHIESAMGNVEASELEEEILASIMMDGPLSATINRVLHAGREMRPANPRFEAGQWRAAEGSDASSLDRTLKLAPATH